MDTFPFPVVGSVYKTISLCPSRNNGMHRGGGSVRTMMALCLGGLVLVTVLYLAKRVDSNRTHRELDLVKVCMKLYEEEEGGREEL